MVVLHLLAQADPTLADLLKYIPSLSGGAVLALVVWAYTTRRIVTKGELDDACAREKQANERADLWQSVALRAMGNNERATSNTERAADIAATAVNVAAVASTAAGTTGVAVNRSP